MGFTPTVVKRFNSGTAREVLVDFTGDSSYPAGGEALSAAELNAIMPEYGGGLLATDADKIALFVAESNMTGHRLALDRTNDKIKAFVAAGTEATGDLSTVTVRALIRYDAQG